MMKDESTELSKNRKEVRQSYDNWKRLEKSSPSNISGVNPTKNQSMLVKERLQTEQFNLENLNQSIKNLSVVINKTLEKLK